ncbi:hypothetical protein EYF80_044175 [Liparis tanakae]|uniref:Uncharacterized protein n=1 Tax=Liparis tanakae TaxID=230148 RepID=A0A4Z2FWL9_9TELE|nr:hypothetical protein EYF80_044175 [Liparis tanakae]
MVCNATAVQAPPPPESNLNTRTRPSDLKPRKRKDSSSSIQNPPVNPSRWSPAVCTSRGASPTGAADGALGRLFNAPNLHPESSRLTTNVQSELLFQPVAFPAGDCGSLGWIQASGCVRSAP